MRRRLPAVTAAAVVAGTLAAMALAGCGETKRVPAPKEVAGPAQRVARVVERLESAIRVRDFETVCDDLFTAAARERSGGDGCAVTLAESAKGLRRPRIRILSIAIAGPTAEARIRSRAAGQRPVEETLQLVRSGRRYRIASLSG